MTPHTFASIAIGTRFRWVENPIIGFTHCKTTFDEYTSQRDDGSKERASYDAYPRVFSSTVELVDKQADEHQERTAKWLWMMDYCKKNGLSSTVKEVWDRAKRAYDEKDLPKPPRNYKAELDMCVQAVAKAAAREINTHGADLKRAFPDQRYVCQEILEEVIRVLQSRV